MSCSPDRMYWEGHFTFAVFPKILASTSPWDDPGVGALCKLPDQCSSQSQDREKQGKTKDISQVGGELGDKKTKCNVRSWTGFQNRGKTPVAIRLNPNQVCSLGGSIVPLLTSVLLAAPWGHCGRCYLRVSWFRSGQELCTYLCGSSASLKLFQN